MMDFLLDIAGHKLMRPIIMVLFLLLLNLCCVTTAVESGSERTEYSEDLLPNIVEVMDILRSKRLQMLHHYPDQDQLDSPTEDEYMNEWVARIQGGENEARKVAEMNDYDLVSKVRGFRDTYVLRKRDVPERTKRGFPHHTTKLIDSPMVLWAEQQRSKRRVKRDHKLDDKPTLENHDRLFNDPFWSKQWPLHDTRTVASLPKLDLHVIGAWKMGYTGKGVVVSILDDGVQRNHSDLAANYDKDASYDLNDDDHDPMPQFNEMNKHGTRCAGEVSMVANNKICGVGVAYNSRIGGVRMLDGKITDRIEAEALQFNIQHVDVFSASWGPNDDGKTVEGPGTLAERAIINAIENGRGGKGTIFVWASGNGGSYGDDCNCDGYTDSIHTLSISSASQSGRFPWYGEKCASTIATTYSSGAYTDQKIATTDLFNECTTEHTGTSASAPLAAGIVALGLEANKNLTWRDVQHIAVWTSEPAPLLENPGWHENALGLLVNTRFGFGLMNAEAFVTAAKDWKILPAQKICKTVFPTFVKRNFEASKSGTVRFQTDGCEGQHNEVNFLEHVQVVTDIEYTRRGNLAIFLTSPNGTTTQLLSPRRSDASEAGFNRWPFMSVHTWGENPKGWWQMEVQDKESHNNVDYGSVNNLTLILYGTTVMPEHYAPGRNYNMEYNSIRDRALRHMHSDAHHAAKKLIRALPDKPAKKHHARDHILRIDRALDVLDAVLTDSKLRHENSYQN